MTIKTRSFDYDIGGATYEAVLASDGDNAKPAVMICHAWAGRSPFENDVFKLLKFSG